LSREIEASDLLATITPTRSSVVMLCGIAGAGNTTVAKQLEAKAFAHLFIGETRFCPVHAVDCTPVLGRSHRSSRWCFAATQWGAVC
jgi:hypothetical protein